MSLDVVGVDYPNKDGSNRRFEILLCIPGEQVHLVPELKNPVDPQAVAVFSFRNVQIGYVRSWRAQLVRTYLSKGRIQGAIFHRVTPFGASVRLGLDGHSPFIPDDAESHLPADDFSPDFDPPYD